MKRRRGREIGLSRRKRTEFGDVPGAGSFAGWWPRHPDIITRRTRPCRTHVSHPSHPRAHPSHPRAHPSHLSHPHLSHPHLSHPSHQPHPSHLLLS